MTFHEERFPARLSKGSVGGPERRTEIVTVKSGHEERNTAWKHSKRRYDAGLALQSLDDLHVVIAFFEVCRAKLCAFRWKDWADYKSCAPNQLCTSIDQEIGVGDGVTKQFQLYKTYRSGSSTYSRKISKPISNTVTVSVGGDELQYDEHFIVDQTSGLVVFEEPPAESALITAGYEFDVPVRFDTDRLEVSVAALNVGDIPNVPVVEVML